MLYMNNFFINCEKSVTKSDIDEIERKLNYNFEDIFIAHYLQFNGGTPSNSCWCSDDEFEPIEISRFKSFKYNEVSGGSDNALIECCYFNMLMKAVIPDNLIPFGIDWGGNFFCVNKNDNSIVFYSVDSFDDELSLKDNHKYAQRYLTHSFGDFIGHLINENELD